MEVCSETYIKDHLGNIKVAFGNEVAGEPPQYGIRQVNAYYPFGMNINTLSASKISKYERNEYLYNGKMFQDELGLDWLDYGARFYDAVIGRWVTEDPMSEKFYSLNPYTASGNNPMLFIDPTGQEIFIYHYISDGNQGGVWVKGHMNEETQKQLEAFAKTKEGYAFLSQYAKAGQKIGNIEFKTDGKYADQNLNFREFDTYQKAKKEHDAKYNNLRKKN